MNPPPWFVETFEREYGGLVALATLMTGSTATAEDVVQDAFAALLGRHHVDEPGAYVRRSVINGSVGRLRRLRRELPDDGRRRDISPDSTGGIADALNCAPGTVGSLLHRGLAALRVQLTPDDGPRADDHSASLPQLREGQP